MLDTNTTLPQSAISLVGSSSADVCHPQVSASTGPVLIGVTCGEDSDAQVSKGFLRKSNLVIKGLMNVYL